VAATITTTLIIGIAAGRNTTAVGTLKVQRYRAARLQNPISLAEMGFCFSNLV
jgi:hypothetical protein